MNDLTDRQKEVLAFIKAYITKNQYPPSQREISSHIGVDNPGGARPHLMALEKKGYIKFELKKARSIQLQQLATADAELAPAIS